MVEEDLNSRIQRIDPLVAKLEAAKEPGIRETARELLATLLDYQGEALSRILETLAEAKHDALIWKLSREPVVESLLLLHGLHPEALERRLERALDKARPALQAHKGDVEVVSVLEGKLRLRLTGTCHGCPSSTVTFRNLIEASVQELAPEVERIEVEGLDFDSGAKVS